ncbi:hypothetical protein QQ008_12945 [Fulvivirgaceae bacterium BMA10]|uniref:SGNH/GDSL hydrolase family protein n=1 Tax=Splendidivirga corallicola TaxID=3051826 RepID=A0ABT8KNG9_9BACT|nr:hypothetical protein [Fulvivirgaceae bacterium BMA10]
MKSHLKRIGRLGIQKILIFVLMMLLVNITCWAQNKKDTLRILFAGNSYTYYENLPQIISVISDSSKTKLITKKSTAGGVYLSDHWHSKNGLKTKELIANGNFDIVVLQEQSMGTITAPDSVHVYAKLLCDFIRKNGAKPYLYMTWAREKVPQQQKTISKVYSEVATKNKAGLVPVGEAWQLARQLRPNIRLYIADGSHPSALGSFLTACVFVKTILQKLPQNLPRVYRSNDAEGESISLMRLDPLDVRFCIRVADETVGKK